MLVLGAKGFAKELMSVLDYKKDQPELCFFDDKTSYDLPILYGKFRVLQTENDVVRYFNEVSVDFVLGVGSPLSRYVLADRFTKLGGSLCSVISGDLLMGDFGNSIGAGVCIMQRVVIETENQIGKGCLIHNAAFISHDVTIGQFCEISPAAQILGSVKIGDFCSIGTGAIILPKNRIGNNVVVGAGAVVTKDVPDNQVVVGVPSKPLQK